MEEESRTSKRARSTASSAASAAPDAPSRTIRVAVEGNIAAGKSTFLNMLTAEFGDVSIVQEPVSKWQNVASDGEDEPTASQQAGGNLLEHFYSDPKRWAYTFQTCAFLSRMKAQHQSVGAEHPGSAVTVFERSVHSDRTCFAANCHASGVLGDMEYSVYCDFHSFLVTSLGGMKLDGVVYLRADPDTCMRRLKLRDRTEEAAVPLDYLEALGKRHEDWLMHRSVTSPGFDPDTPVLVLDCNPDFNEDGEQRSVLLRQTRSFFDRLTDAANAGQQRAQGGGGAEGPAVREPSPDLF